MSEPEHIGEIIPRVWRDIEQRMQRRERRSRKMVERLKQPAPQSCAGPTDNSDLWAMRDDLPEAREPEEREDKCQS